MTRIQTVLKASAFALAALLAAACSTSTTPKVNPAIAPDKDVEAKVEQVLQGMTLEDVKAFQQKWIKDRKYIYGFLGRQSDFDMDFVRSLGPVTELSLEEIFGY